MSKNEDNGKESKEPDYNGNKEYLERRADWGKSNYKYNLLS
ncbi:MAG: hypothetical protein WAM88_12605 [Nitrososphaeraceae archaeon]|jgi:hypothetical protein